MPSALFEIYQKNFDKTLKRLSGMIELYQNQTKEAQSITLKEIELNISEMERAISQMELEVILEKIPDNKKKLSKIIENNKNIVKQYKREIQDLKYKEQSILNKKNLAQIPSNKTKKTIQLNFLKEEKNNINFDNSFKEDEDTALFIDKNNLKKNNFDKYTINDNTNDEMNLKKDEAIKRINEHNNKQNENFDLIPNINNSDDFGLSNKQKQKDNENDKDLETNKYKLNKDNLFKKIIRILINIIQYLFIILKSFYQNILYKGYKNLRHYLNHRYGQSNSWRIMMVLFIISFLIFYSIILYIINSYKIKKVEKPVNLILKNNSNIIETKKEEINNLTNNKTNSSLLNNTNHE